MPRPEHSGVRENRDIGAKAHRRMTNSGMRVGLDRTMESDVRALYRALIEGWNRRNAAAMGRLFVETGSVVGFDGSQIEGAAAIESTMANIFARHATPPFVAVVRDVRRLGPGTALLRAVVGMTPSGKTELDPALNAIQSLVAVRDGDRWRVALFQNTPAAFHGRPELVAQMTEELSAAAAAPERRRARRRA